MLTSSIDFKIFKHKKFNTKIKKNLETLLKDKNSVINSLTKDYKNTYESKKIINLQKNINTRIIGIGGSILGAKAIYSFLQKKIIKKIQFIDNLETIHIKKNKDKLLNLIISKSGNTLETISNVNILVKKNDKNIFITEKKESYLYTLAKKLKAEIIHHNNFIGGRFSVLSEVGMIPAELMGLEPKKFKQLDQLIKNKNFLDTLVLNVSSILNLSKNKKHNSIIINYDPMSEDLFAWYQQLVAESLGKKGKGILPIVSNMPKDNHSVMQLYLDGFKNNFFTLFFAKEKKSSKIINNTLLSSFKFLKHKNINQINEAQKSATENIFIKKKIPFRSFEIKERNEKTLGELFCFFILETILLGKALNVNPYDQPSVELIKTETKKILT